MATEINATYRVVTPLFCAGANPKCPEFRLTSFKGVLRFWWRVLAWSRCGENLDAIRKEEDALFGSAGGGQSRVAMRLDAVPKPETIPVNNILKVPGTDLTVGEGARYLGYGVMEAFASKKKHTEKGQLTRACLRAPFDFTVCMRVPSQDVQELPSLTDALIALGTLGGMGAKSRKGYGSLALQSLTVDGKKTWSTPQSIKELKSEITRLRRGSSGAHLPEFTALSNKSRIVLVSTSLTKKPIELLDLVGREMLRFRSWGHGGKVLGSKSECNFMDDHDLMKDVKKGIQPQSHPRRIAFGLPHNYGKFAVEQVGPFDKHLDRRGSPLFIHIHECGDTPIAALSFLPARFLPKGKSYISVGGIKVQQTPEARLYRPIRDFLNRLLDPKQRKEPFTSPIEVQP